ncbi:ketoacyl-ACP synthase III [bacterium]|nr:ketoacyl-ACP synthase III [bacterium]
MGTKGFITGTGMYLPEKIVTNFDLEKIVDTSDEWITQRTGIKERRISRDDEPTSELAYKAGMKAIEDAGLTPDEIDMIIVGTFTPDMLFPSCACIVAKKMGLEGIPALDLEAACSGFVYSLTIASQFIENGVFENILVIGADETSKTVDWSDRTVCVLFGDGAGAFVLSSKGTKNEIKGFGMGSRGSGHDCIVIPAGGSRIPATQKAIDEKLHFLTMKGKDVYRFAINIVSHTIKQAFNESNMEVSDLKYIIPHQANIRIIKSAAKKMGLNEDNITINLDKYGNTVAATIPIGFHEFINDGKSNSGEIAALVGFGGGLSWCTILVEL